MRTAKLWHRHDLQNTFSVGKILGHGAGGALHDKIMVRHAGGGTSELTFKSYDQERSKWQE